MAKLENIFFNRVLDQFLECKNLDNKKSLALFGKIGAPAKNNFDKVLELRQAR
jgi:hypothetical protein